MSPVSKIFFAPRIYRKNMFKTETGIFGFLVTKQPFEILLSIQCCHHGQVIFRISLPCYFGSSFIRLAPQCRISFQVSTRRCLLRFRLLSKNEAFHRLEMHLLLRSPFCSHQACPSFSSRACDQSSVPFGIEPTLPAHFSNVRSPNLVCYSKCL